MSKGTRVIYRAHPEYGYGIVRYEEENVLGERRLQIAFDHIDALLELDPSQVDTVPTPEEDARSQRFGSVDSLRRRVLASLVAAENNATSVFLKTSTKPLPHQASVLDKLLSGERFGHLFADDVGLGKTIEAGLLITSILSGARNQRILVVCPAGVALQWQEELEEHFSLFFSVLGIDFKGASVSQWRNHIHVIAPIDRLKSETYSGILPEIGPFDLIICDEAHRLNASRNRITKELVKTQNYRLFERIVAERAVSFVSQAGAPRSPRMVFLSATPHQGDDLRFLYLLNLLRPDLFPIQGENLELLKAERLREVMTRTPKSMASDWDGKPIFKGHETRTLDVQWSVEEVEVSKLLTTYITSSLAAVTDSGRPNPLVVTLVMHTFHKIAASSWHALTSTLRQRLAVIQGRSRDFESGLELDDDEFEGLPRAAGELDRAFFAEEQHALLAMLQRLASLSADRKWESCCELLTGLEREKPGCKVLFFTQFRATQRYLAQKLDELFPGSGIEVVNGDVALLDRRAARKRFEGQSRFMVSTEAGGEGVNLQKSCHLMVNYDLAWNPMRMQQRIGRLDRYGQKHRVTVFNLRVPDSWDARISTRIEERLEVIQRTMGEVVASDIENYREMILGEVAEKIDPAAAFREHLKGGELKNSVVDDYLRQAVASMQRWKDRMEAATEPVLAGHLKPVLATTHFHAAYGAALESMGLRLQESRTSANQYLPGVYHFTLPSEFRDNQLRAGREHYVVFDREVYQNSRDQDLGNVRGQPIRVNLAGFGESFTDWVFQRAVAADGSPSAYRVRAPSSWSLGSGWIVVFHLRFLGSGRRLLVPDAVLGAFAPATGGAQVLDLAGLFDLCASAQHAGDIPPLPDLGPALALARDELRRRVELRGTRSAAVMGLSIGCLIAMGE